MSATDTIADTLVVDHGPVSDAALTLIQRSTLADHVTVVPGVRTTEIKADDSIPFELWGSGTQALWRLLSAIAYTRHEVSLYEVVARLDQRNAAAVAAAVVALCGVSR